MTRLTTAGRRVTRRRRAGRDAADRRVDHVDAGPQGATRGRGAGREAARFGMTRLMAGPLMRLRRGRQGQHEGQGAGGHGGREKGSHGWFRQGWKRRGPHVGLRSRDAPGAMLARRSRGHAAGQCIRQFRRLLDVAVDPRVIVPRVEDDRHPVMHRPHPFVCRRGQDGAGQERRAGFGPPRLPYPDERKGLVVGEAEGEGLLRLTLPPPLEKTAGRDEAAARCGGLRTAPRDREAWKA